MIFFRWVRRIAPFLPVLFAVWMLLAMYLTLFPSDLLTSAARLGNPKLGHVILFGGWTFLFGLLLFEYFKKRSFSILAIVLAGILFGAAIELMQYLMPFDRSGSLADIGFNTVGAAGAGLMLWLYRIRTGADERKKNAFRESQSR
jgi:glycopeptide antibiotics resistance protein